MTERSGAFARRDTERWRTLWLRTLPLAFATLLACAPSHAERYRSLRVALDHHTAASPLPATDPDPDAVGSLAVLERAVLIEATLRRNPTLRAARQAWRAATARYPQAVSLADPVAGIGAAPKSFGSSSVNNAPQFDLRQHFPFPGKLALRGEVALGEAEASQSSFESARVELATVASLLYDDYYLAERALEINAQHTVLLRELQELATLHYESGEASQQDPIQAEVALAHALHQRVLLETRRQVLRERLNTLLHRRIDLPLPPPPETLPVPADPRGGSGDLIDTALRQSPEVAAAEASVRADEAAVKLARREYLPDFTLVGAYNQVHQERDLQPFVGLTFNVPLRLARRRGAVEEAEAELESARSTRAAIEDNVRLDVQSSLDRVRGAREVLRLFRDRLLPPARDHVDAARSGFEAGQNSFLALIEAERNLRTVELGFEKALTDVSRHRAELDRSLGQLPGLSW